MLENYFSLVLFSLTTDLPFKRK